MEDLSKYLQRTNISDLPGKILVAAIDFGTTFSGWAYSFKHEFKTDPKNIHAKKWNNGTNISTKAPTTVLIEPDGKTFHAFGYDAEDKYAQLCAQGSHREWFFFTRFKMMLHEKLHFEDEPLLEDATGKRLIAKDVFRHAIAFLRGDLKQEYSRKLCTQIDDAEVLWVLTVPAIWNMMARKFMRDAAVEAGINDSCLKIALEPEAASLHCMMVPVTKQDADLDVSSFCPGAKYMVVDAGGGTVDVSVHQVLDGESLRELYKASGGAWGGEKVQDAFIRLLTKIFGASVINKFRDESMEDYIDLLRSLEIRKRKITSTSDGDTTISLPTTLVDTLAEERGASLKAAVCQTDVSELISVQKGNKIRIKASLMRNLFSEAVDNITGHISHLLQKNAVKDVQAILLVGGFSECKLLQESVEECCKNVKVVVPAKAGLSVLKGAVVFGYHQRTIKERILQYTYGIASFEAFNDDVHPVDKLTILNGIRKCDDVFAKLVEIDQSIKVDEIYVSERTWTPSSSIAVSFQLYASTQKCPAFVTEKTCFRVGELSVTFDEDTPANLIKIFKLCGYFGEPEIHIDVEDINTGQKYFAKFELPK